MRSRIRKVMHHDKKRFFFVIECGVGPFWVDVTDPAKYENPKFDTEEDAWNGIKKLHAGVFDAETMSVYVPFVMITFLIAILLILIGGKTWMN